MMKIALELCVSMRMTDKACQRFIISKHIRIHNDDIWKGQSSLYLEKQHHLNLSTDVVNPNVCIF